MTEAATVNGTKKLSPTHQKAPDKPSDPFSSLETVDLTGIKLPANVMFSNAGSSLMVGNSYNTSLGLTGVCRRLRWVMSGGYVVLDVQVGGEKGPITYVVVTQSGMEGPVKL